MLMPKRVKHRKVQRGRMKGKAQRGNFLAYGEYGIVATQPGWITSNQIEAARQAMTRRTKRGGQVWIKIFPDKPVTAKPAETRMGSGKGRARILGGGGQARPACCSRSAACLRNWAARRCAWPPTSSPSAPSSSRRKRPPRPLPRPKR